MQSKQIYKLIIAITVAGLVLMAGLVATGITLASRSSAMKTTQPVALEAMMSLSPTYGGANTFVNITGFGFPQNERVDFYLVPAGSEPGDQPDGGTLTDGEGRFVAMFPMPAAWRDGSPITDTALEIVALSEDGLLGASAAFAYQPVVQPEIVVDPIAGPAGTPVMVTSIGFTPGVRVNLHIGPPEGGYTVESYGEALADAAGRVAIAFSMPDAWPNGERIRQEQLEIAALSDDGKIASAGFDYAPVTHPIMESFSPNYGGPGTVVNIDASGFPAGRRVFIHVGTSIEDAAKRTPYVETMADPRGRVALPFAMPERWPGGLPIRTRDTVLVDTPARRATSRIVVCRLRTLTPPRGEFRRAHLGLHSLARIAWTAKVCTSTIPDSWNLVNS